MINVYLCEDEPVQLAYFKKQIERYLKNTGKNACLISAQINPEKTIEDAKKHSGLPSLFFIDIELKGYCVDGFWLVQELLNINSSFEFVFLTAHKELAYKVFDQNLQIIDYIVKNPEYFLKDDLAPVVIERLDYIFHKMETNIKNRERLLWFDCGSRKVYIDPKEIIYIQSDRPHYYMIHCVSMQLVVRSTIPQLLEKLGDGFVEISRAAVISLRHVESIKKEEKIVVLDNGQELPISRYKNKSIYEMIEKQEGRM